MLSSESEVYPEWKALLTELLAAIAKRLTSITDYSSFRGVCTSWRCAATFHNFDREFPRAPRLLYFLKETEDTPFKVSEETPLFAKLFDLESNTNKIANFSKAKTLDKCVSCSGWILVPNILIKTPRFSYVTEFSLKHFMLGINIKLPSSSDIFISKMVLSGSPMEEESGLVVMVIWGFNDQLAFCRPGDERWTLMDRWNGHFCDIIYHNRKLYAMDYAFGIVECNIHGSNPTKIVEVIPPDGLFGENKFDVVQQFLVQQFLVESFGKFLIVLQFRSWNKTYYFRIFEIELKDGSYEEIDNIGDRCLFLSPNSSICVASSTVEALKPNCIYFSENNPYICKPQVGVFYRFGGRGCGRGYFEEPQVRVFYRLDGNYEGSSCRPDYCFPMPVWVVPSI